MVRTRMVNSNSTAEVTNNKVMHKDIPKDKESKEESKDGVNVKVKKDQK
jgi:hypothetical protein